VAIPQDVVENLILCGAFDRLHEHRRGILWRLDETTGMARAYRSDAVQERRRPASTPAHSQKPLPLGDPSVCPTPTAWDIPDFSPWDKFVWTWRITGVCAECHAMAYMRDLLDQDEVLRVCDVQRLKPGIRIRVAGINVRPHRPPTRSGEPVLFSQIEDETGLLAVTVVGEAIGNCTATFLTSPAVLAEGVVERRGCGASLRIEKVANLVLQETPDGLGIRGARSDRVLAERAAQAQQPEPVLVASGGR
jgi:error-prone DNA polymerase